MNKRVFMLFLTIALVHVVVGRAEALKAFDDKLDVKLSIQQTLNIKTHEDVRDIRYNSFRTTFRTEGLYKMVTNDSWNIKLYGLTSYFYDEVLDLESPMRHSIRDEAGSRSQYRHAQRPRDSEEWLKEAYVDVGYRDLFTIRLGKQIVSWGETAEEAVADLVNPIDVKYQVAFPDWEDYKLGLWMARIFYTPQNFWQDLAFELIVIPFNFVEQRMPVAGSGFWVGQTTPNDPVDELLTAWRHDAPSETFKNLELGLRIKGFADILEGVDWYLSHFYSRQDAPVVTGPGGFTNFVFGVMGLKPQGKVFDYPFYHSTAFLLLPLGASRAC